jgi:hypothetical protein
MKILISSYLLIIKTQRVLKLNRNLVIKNLKLILMIVEHIMIIY